MSHLATGKLLFFALLLGLGTFQGCAKNEFGTLNITGTVTVDSTAMEGVNVSFIPQSPEGRECYGTTDAQGKFILTIPGTEMGSGAMPGEYVVTFSKMSNPSDGLSEEEIAKKFPKGRPEDVNLLPTKYADRTQTDIDPVTVKKGKKNEFSFELSSK